MPVPTPIAMPFPEVLRMLPRKPRFRVQPILGAEPIVASKLGGDDVSSFFRKASEDYIAARILFQLGPWQAALYHLGACMEKMLKAYLLDRHHSGVSRHRHKTEQLRQACEKEDAFFGDSDLRQVCESLQAGFSQMTRYGEAEVLSAEWAYPEVLWFLDWFYFSVRAMLQFENAVCMDPLLDVYTCQLGSTFTIQRELQAKELLEADNGYLPSYAYARKNLYQTPHSEA